MWRPEDLHVVVLARAVFTLHGRGGLERHVYDLVRHLAYRGVRITLVTRPPTTIDGQASLDDDLPDDRVTMRFVPYRTFPLAGRRGTTVIDRSTAYPLFGWRAGRLAARLVRAGGVQVVHGLGASALGYASARRGAPLETVPFVFNPQGLEEFGATDPTRARLKRLAYRPLQAAVRACATAADRVIATDRVLVPVVLGALPIPPSRLAIVPNAIDVAAIDKLTTAAARSPDELTMAAAPSPDERGGLGQGTESCSASVGSKRTRDSTCSPRRSPASAQPPGPRPGNVGDGLCSETARIDAGSSGPYGRPGSAIG